MDSRFEQSHLGHLECRRQILAIRLALIGTCGLGADLRRINMGPEHEHSSTRPARQRSLPTMVRCHRRREELIKRSKSKYQTLARRFEKRKKTIKRRCGKMKREGDQSILSKRKIKSPPPHRCKQQRFVVGAFIEQQMLHEGVEAEAESILTASSVHLNMFMTLH